MATSEAFTLPEAVRPLKYALKLEPDLDQFTFKGEENIAVDVVETTSEIVLNAIELQVQSATLTQDGSAIKAAEIRLDSSQETVTLDFGQAIAPGRAELAVEFTGILNDKLRGFYRSQYTTTEGNQKYLAATQFEATDARRAFPCWDEPARKAAFEVTLVIPSALKAISNTPDSERVTGTARNH